MSGFVTELILVQAARKRGISTLPPLLSLPSSSSWHEHQPRPGTDALRNYLFAFSLPAGLVFREISFLTWQMTGELLLARGRAHDPAARPQISLIHP